MHIQVLIKVANVSSLCAFITVGSITISEVTFDSNRLTLTCISTGGPATTVTWTRDSITVTEGTETVLNNAVTAQYTHTLTVTTGGEYTCTVSNNKPSSGSANIILGSMCSSTNNKLSASCEILYVHTWWLPFCSCLTSQ